MYTTTDVKTLPGCESGRNQCIRPRARDFRVEINTRTVVKTSPYVLAHSSFTDCYEVYQEFFRVAQVGI